jgi:uncharacterized repeat protein (TIGR01451 family)
MRKFSTFLALQLLCMGLAAGVSAATFNVANPGEFQDALEAAQSNGENDVINVAPCSGAGCSGGVYTLTTPLTYNAVATENFSLTIDGFDSDTRILSGNSTVPILRISTLNATNDFGAQFTVRNLTFVNGNAAGDPADGGALAIEVNGAFIEISGSVFADNAADDDGGAVFLRLQEFGEAPVNIIDTTFARNEARGITGSGTGDGGALHVEASGGTGVFITDTDFIDNTAQGNGGGAEIAGLDPSDPEVARITAVSFFDVQFTGNSAGGNGGGADVGANSVFVEIAGFVDNSATNGAGLHVRENFFDLGIVNAGFAGNAASGDGGALATESNFGATVTLTNNTIYGNGAVGRGGGALVTIGGSTGRARLYNNILYANTDAIAGFDVFIDNDPFSDIPAEVQFFNNAITELTGFPDLSKAFGIVSSSALTAGGNIDDEPVLPNINQPDPDPDQAASSPTIDAGDNAAPLVPSEDYAGDSRPLDGDLDGTATVDIGMDEFVPGALPDQADLTVTKTDSPDPVTGGNEVTYAIRVTNAGPDDATGVVVSDTLDPGVTLVSALFGQGTPCVAGGSPVVVNCELGGIVSGDEATGTIVVATPVVEVNQVIDNTVTVAGNETDPDGTNNTADTQTTVVPAGPAQADLAVTKLDSPDPVFSAGPDLVYTITVDNNGPDAATGVTLTDTLPAGVIFLSATAGAGTCGNPDAGGTLVCELGSLAAGSNATVTVIVTPEPVTEPTELTNTATVAAVENDPVPGNNSVTATTTLNPPSADMSVGVTSTPSAPAIGDTVTYTITVGNDGPSSNSGVTVTATLPAGATFESATIDQGDCELVEGSLVCTIGVMEAGAGVTAEVVITTPDVAGTLTFIVEVSGDANDPATENDTAEEVTEVIGTVNLRVRGVGGAGAVGWTELALLALAALAGAGAARRRSRARAGTMIACLMALMLLVPAPAPQAQTGWYAGGNVGQADAGYAAGDLVSDLAARGWTIDTPQVDDSDTAYKLYGGFAFSPVLAIEFGWADLGEVVTEYGATVAPAEIDDLLADTFAVHPVLGQGWFVAGVVSWPVMPERLSLYGRAGLFAWDADIDVRVISGGTGRISGDDSGTDWMWGVGFDWRLNPAWSVTAEWERYRLNDWVDVPSVGVRFRF